MALDIFTETTLNQILDKLKLQNAYLSLLTGPQAATPWESYKAISDEGHLPEVLSVGDTLTESWTDLSATPPVTYTVSFKVMHFGDAEDENGKVYHNKAFLCWTKGTPYMLSVDERERVQVDLSEEATAQADTCYVGYDGTNYTLLELSTGDELPTTYSKLYKLGLPSALPVQSGYNRWKCSNYRQWLNSDAPASQWWQSDHLGCVEPASAAARPGFLSGFSESFRAFLRPYKVRTLLSVDEALHGDQVYEDTYDKVFLPSVEQVMGVPEVSGVEGEAWDAMKALSGLSVPTNDAASARAFEDIAVSDTKRAMRLRTPVLNNSGKVYAIGTTGSITSDSAYLTARCTPVIIL